MYSIPENKMEKLIPSLNDVKKIDPITIWLLKADVYNKVYKYAVVSIKDCSLCPFPTLTSTIETKWRQSTSWSR